MCSGIKLAKMSQYQTLTIIKPHAVRENKAGAILSMLCNSGFRISALKMIKLTREHTEEFYVEHRGKYFFGPLVDMMSSGPVVVALLEKENAVTELRRLVGNTDPEQAAPGTVRKLFGISMRENAVHASDGENNAARECAFFFSFTDRFSFR